MPITTASIREPMPEGALRGALQPDGTVIWYMPGDTLPPEPPPGPPPVPRSIPKRLGRLVLLGSGKLGPGVTTLAQLDAAILGAIDSLIPAGMQREAARGAYLDSTVWESGNATLVAMMTALGMSAADRDAMFIQARAMRNAELAAQGLPPEVD